MALIRDLATELRLRIDCVEADFERLIESGSNREALERLITHSMEIGIIKDKLENIRTHDLLVKKDEEEDDGNI